MITGRDVVLISSIEWDFNWQGNQEIPRRLAKAGNRVLYIENMGVRAPRLHDAKRVARRFSHWAGSLPHGGVREVARNLYVCSPLILPPFGSRVSHQINHHALLPLIRSVVKNLRLKPEIIWTFLPTDTVASLVKMLRTPDAVVVYYCIADFAELAPHSNDILKSERSIIEMSDVVFAQCAQLAEHCSMGNKQVEIFPFGVDFNLFGKRNGHSNSSPNGNHATAKSASSSAAMSGLPRPIIGYVGGIHKFFHAEMVAAMAHARPDWSWVLVGPLQTSPRELKRIPNVHLFGPKAHEELPDYIRGFDVGIVPYLSNNYTATVVPTKINEYLAMGKPVVATNLPEVASFNRQHGVLITSANDSVEFVASIEKAIESSAEVDAVNRRRTVAAANDWEKRFERMSNLIESELRKKRGSRDQKATGVGGGR